MLEEDGKVYIGWSDLWALIPRLSVIPEDNWPGTRIYGVPRGGVHVAQEIARRYDGVEIVSTPAAADVIVDDLIDSGRTRERFHRYDVPFVTLVDKSKPQWRGKWVVFPWELEDEKDDEDHAARLLEHLGIPLDTSGTRDTPSRLVKSLRELTDGYGADPIEILSKRFEAKYDEMVVVRDIGFWSMCEHHVLPFHGTATVAYIPNGQVVGLSKLARLVRAYSRRLQIQERMTEEIAEAMVTALNPLGAACVIKATHLCMAMRGIENPAEMVTSSLHGKFREPEVRAEFLSLSE